MHKLPAPFANHEVDDFGRHLLGGTEEIPFVFAIFGIDDNHRSGRWRMAAIASSMVEN